MYKILLLFLAVGYFYPWVGFLALICMIGPVVMAMKRGRYWCGHYCPRGNLYDAWISRFTRQKSIPPSLRSKGFRIFMILLIFAMFGVQMHEAWGDLAKMGAVFLRIILLTTIVGIVVGVVYRPRAWCSFCPMGTMAAWAAPKKNPYPSGFAHLTVNASCVNCTLCAKACPLELDVYTARGNGVGFMDGDCLKCGRCIEKCPKQAIGFSNIK